MSRGLGARLTMCGIQTSLDDPTARGLLHVPAAAVGSRSAA
ncbi:MAG TPA: hypothetical protein VFH94_01550 [Streptomyces sp.]|nr:hypothetical protein [Streptomyces sp.]